MIGREGKALAHRLRVLVLVAAPAALAGCTDPGTGSSEATAPEDDLVFYSDRSGSGDIYLISADGFRDGSFRARRLLGTGAADFGPRWVPQGPGLVFISAIEEPPALYALAPEADGMSVRLGTNPSLDEPPAFTPDGRRVVFSAVLDEGMDLFLGDLSGAEPQRITFDGARKIQPAVSPDGEWVVFAEGPDGRQDLVLMRLDGSGRRSLTEGPSNDGHPSWLPDGSGIVFDSNRAGVGTDIFHLDLSTGGMRNLTNDPGIDLVATVSPDGKWVAFGSSRSGNWDLFLTSLEGGPARQITASPTFEGDPRWVPAGTFPPPGDG